MNLQKEQGSGYRRCFKRLRMRSSVLSASVKILGICATCFLLEACYGTPRSAYKVLPAKDKNAERLVKNGETKNAVTTESVAHDAGAVKR